MGRDRRLTSTGHYLPRAKQTIDRSSLSAFIEPYQGTSQALPVPDSPAAVFATPANAEVSVVPAAPAPTGLAATSCNASASLSWNASDSATSYNIKRSLASGTGYSTVQSSAALSYSDFGVANGTTYYYVVSAVNSVGESPNSTEVSVRASEFSRGNSSEVLR